MIGAFLVFLLVWFFYKLLTKPGRFIDTDFYYMRKDYFDRTGLSKKLPRGRWNWK